MTESCALMTALRLASMASSQSVKHFSGVSATPSRESSSCAAFSNLVAGATYRESVETVDRDGNISPRSADFVFAGVWVTNVVSMRQSAVGPTGSTIATTHETHGEV